MCLYNVKRKFNDLEDLQNMISVAESLDNAYGDNETQRGILKKFLLSNDMLSSGNIMKLRIEDMLVRHLTELENFINNNTYKQDENTAQILQKIIASEGEFVAKFDKSVDYVIDVDDSYDMKQFLQSYSDMQNDFSLKTVLLFVYKNGLDKVSFNKMTGNKTAYNDLMIVRPVLETVQSGEVAQKFADNRLGEFYAAVLEADSMGSDEMFIKQLEVMNEEYIDLTSESVTKFLDAEKTIIDSYGTQLNPYDRVLRERFAYELTENIVRTAPSLVKLFKKNSVSHTTLEDCLMDYYTFTQTDGKGTKFDLIKNSDNRNEIIKEQNKVLSDMINRIMEEVVSVSEKIRTYEEDTVKLRVSRAGNRLVSTVIEKW